MRRSAVLEVFVYRLNVLLMRIYLLWLRIRLTVVLKLLNVLERTLLVRRVISSGLLAVVRVRVNVLTWTWFRLL